MNKLQRISDGVVFDVLGTKTGPSGRLNPDGSGAKHAEWESNRASVSQRAAASGAPPHFRPPTFA